MVCLTMIIDRIEPNTINKEWNHSDQEERVKWLKLIKDELKTMIKKFSFQQ